MTRPGHAPRRRCGWCNTECLVAIYPLTGEEILVDLDPVPGGNLKLLTVPGSRVPGFTARVFLDHEPKPPPPAHQLHTVSCARPSTESHVEVETRDDAGLEQAGGWRRG